MSGPFGSFLQALVRVRLADGVETDVFEAYLRDEVAVVDAWRLASDTDYEVHVACPSLSDLNNVVTSLRHAGGAAATSTTLVLHRVPLETR